MIEQATERRLAGDWRGACAVAAVDVAFDLARVQGEYGPALADRLADDLLSLAPDLLRWHLPRAVPGRGTFAAGLVVPLVRYPGGPALVVRTPRRVSHPQRLRLDLLPAGAVPAGAGVETLEGHRHLFDVRHADELCVRCGGDAARAPFLHADATPRAPGGPHPTGAAATEWVTMLQDEGRWAQACAAAGLRPHGGVDGSGQVYGHLALSRLRAEAGVDRSWGPLWVRVEPESVTSHRVRVYAHPWPRTEPSLDAPGWRWLPRASWRRLPDLDLLRFGLIDPDDLHPLVHKALFPARVVTARPVGPPEVAMPAPVQIRCRDRVHALGLRGGRLTPVGEVCREYLLGALSGEPSDCRKIIALWHGEHLWQRRLGDWHRPPIEWQGRPARLPKAFRRQIGEFFELVGHGDTPAVLRWLDAGFDPAVRDGMGRNLTAFLPWLDHGELLPRLVAAGVPVQREALRRAVRHGSADLIRGLLEAAPKEYRWRWESLTWYCAQEVWYSRRRDLQFVWDYVS
jgi:hypothetical protein